MQEDDLKCTVCLERFKPPVRVFPCGHSFCHSCVELRTAQDRQDVNENGLSCPKCDQMASECSIMADLPIYDPIHQLLDKMKRSTDQMQENDEGTEVSSCCTHCDNEAVSHCLDCDDHLCLPCRQTHRRVRVTRSHHNIVNLKEPKQPEVELKRKVRQTVTILAGCLCSSHGREDAKYFCEECDQTICNECSLLVHQGHKCYSIGEACVKQKAIVQNLLQETKARVPHLQAAVQAISKMNSSVEKKAELVERKIKEECAEMKKKIDEREGELVQELQALTDQKRQQLSAQKQTLERVHAFAERHCGIAEEVLSNEEEFMLAKSKVAQSLTWASKKMQEQLVPCQDDCFGFYSCLHQTEQQQLSLFKSLGRIVTASALHTIVEGTKQTRYDQTKTLTVIVRDEKGQRKKTGGDIIEAEITLPAGMSGAKTTKGSVRDGLDGSYVVSWQCQEIGEHKVEVHLNGKPIRGSPVTVDVGKNNRDYSAEGQKPKIHFGSKGSAYGELNHPCGIAVDKKSGNIIVADTGNHRIQVFDCKGNFLRAFGSKGIQTGQFGSPCGVAVDKQSGNIIVADTDNSRIQVFDSNGVFVRAFGSLGSSNGELHDPLGVAVDRKGNIIVADTENNRIQVFNSCGHFLHDFGEFLDPSGVAVNKEGDIIVADTNSHCIQVFDFYGNIKHTFGSEGTSIGKFKGPCGVAVDRNSNILVVDDDRIQVFNFDGAFVGTIGDQFNRLDGIAVDKAGNVIVLNLHLICCL